MSFVRSYALPRLVQWAVVILVGATVTFIIPRLLPTDPVEQTLNRVSATTVTDEVEDFSTTSATAPFPGSETRFCRHPGRAIILEDCIKARQWWRARDHVCHLEQPPRAAISYAQPVAPDIDVALLDRRDSEHPASSTCTDNVEHHGSTRVIGPLGPPAHNCGDVSALGLRIDRVRHIEQVRECVAIGDHQRARTVVGRNAEFRQSGECIGAGANRLAHTVGRTHQGAVTRTSHNHGNRIQRLVDGRKHRLRNRTRSRCGPKPLTQVKQSNRSSYLLAKLPAGAKCSRDRLHFRGRNQLSGGLE